MKRFIHIAFVLISFCTLQSQSLVWSDPVEVAEGYDNLRPRLALTTGDHPVIVWGGSGNRPVYTARWNGTSFDEPVAVSPEGIDPYCASWVGPDVAAHGNEVWVVFDAEVGNDFRVYTVRSEDGGNTFGDTVNAGGYSGLTRFTAIGIGDDGNPLVTFMEHDPGYANPRYVVANTPDKGESWSQAVDGSNSLTGNEVCDCCPAEILSDGTNQVLLFRNNDANLRDIWAGISTDAGNTFSAGADIDEAGWVISACPSTGPDGFIRGDSAMVVWTTGGYDGPRKVMLTSVSKTSAEAGPNIMISPDAPGGQNYPRIHGNDQVFGLVYQETINGSMECLFAYGTQGSTAFDASGIYVNDEESGNQMNPDVVYSNGVFHFTYQDNYSGNVIYRTAELQEVGIGESVPVAFDVYPNPVRDRLHIEWSPEVHAQKVYLLNNQMQRVFETTVNQEDQSLDIETTGLPAGFYIVAIETVQAISMRKLVVNH